MIKKAILLFVMTIVLLLLQYPHNQKEYKTVILNYNNIVYPEVKDCKEFVYE